MGGRAAGRAPARRGRYNWPVPAAGPHPDRLFPADPSTRAVARALHEQVAGLPVVSVHGHVDPALLRDDPAFTDPASLLVTPDHYVTRLLHSRGVPLEDLGVARRDGGPVAGPRQAWATLCAHWPALAGTTPRYWLEHVLAELFGITGPLGPERADETYDRVAALLATPAYRPRALYRRFGVEVLATTDDGLSDLAAHRALAADPGFDGRVIPTFRPDELVDPDRAGWRAAVETLCGGALPAGARGAFRGYLSALADRRADFAAAGARATDHAPLRAATAHLGETEAARLFDRLRAGRGDAADRARFGAHMLTEMAQMSCDDGLVMQLHPGVRRDHDGAAAVRFGPDVGADIPLAAEFTDGLRPLLERCGHHERFSLVVYTVDETAWSRELAPMAGYWPALSLGAPWWFLDAPDAVGRYLSAVAESAGYANLAGFVDDTRAFCSLRARHDMARRAVCAHLATMVTTHRLSEEDAGRIARDFAYDRPRTLYGL